VAKMLEQQKRVTFFNSRAFSNALVTHYRVAHAAHKSLQFQHSNLCCFDISVDLKKIVKIKGVP
jgi:hypothetical protein